MKAAKAIEINTDFLRGRRASCEPDVHDAIKLGTEALKRLQNCRQHPFTPIYGPLPGEEDWRDV